MTAHRAHPVTGDWHGKNYADPPEGAVLYDDCDRCTQHARHPLDSLDDDHLRPLVRDACTALAGPVPDQPTEAMLTAVHTIREEIRRADAVLHRVRTIQRLAYLRPDDEPELPMTHNRPSVVVPDGPPPTTFDSGLATEEPRRE